jgi:adenosylcobinamide kinase / adenosylcobinamide-phosphate guanylyltransferase
MHFVTGGAFNGKRKWVKQKYGEDVDWRSMYTANPDIASWGQCFSQSTIVVLEGVEQYIKFAFVNNNPSFPRQTWCSFLDTWRKWESDDQRTVIWIGTDMMKGIVPIDPLERKWRDYTGWAYQELVQYCNTVSVIWYGLEQRLKNEEENQDDHLYKNR